MIAYASRGLRPSETNYPAHKLEFLALKWAVCDKLHDYYMGTSLRSVRIIIILHISLQRPNSMLQAKDG